MILCKVHWPESSGFVFLGAILQPLEYIICQRDKTHTSSNRYEHLIKCTTETAAISLAAFAQESSSEYVKAQLYGLNIREIIAREFYYHRTCQRNITRTDKDMSEEYHKRESCFASLVAHVQKTITQERNITTIAALSKYYEILQTKQQIPVMGVLLKDVKQRLKLKFKDELTFYQKSKRQSQFVYHKDAQIEEDERSWFFMNIKEKIMKVAEIIREEIEKSLSPFSRWPPQPDEILNKNVVVPNMLDLFLKSLFSRVHPVSKRVEHLCKSVGQDIVYNQSKGKLKTVKHVQLGIVTKRRTGLRFLFDVLNRMGHSISYDEVNNVETSFAEHQMHHQSRRSFVPNNIQPSTFITFVYDNCDHNPETLSGTSLHCTNGIIIQRPTQNHPVHQSDHVPTVNERVGILPR